MRATTIVTLGAGMLMGGLVFAALVPPDALPGGGAAGPSAVVQPSPIDDIVEASLRHAQDADAAVRDGHLSVDPTTPTTPRARRDAANAESTLTPDADIAKATGWQPPAHDLPQGVYFDDKTLLLVGPRWVYEVQASERVEPVRTRWAPLQVGLLPVIAMGYMQGGEFVRWARGEGWLANDVAGPALARRRTRLRRHANTICVEDCLTYSTARADRRGTHALHALFPPNLLSQSSRLGPLQISQSATPLPTGLPRNAVQFSISWADDDQATHIWGTRAPEITPAKMYAARPVEHTVTHPPAHRLIPQDPPGVRAGWPKVAPDRVECVCLTGDCAPDDRSPHIVAATQIELTGLPWRSERWRCDRPNARRRWSLKPLGVSGFATLITDRSGMPRLTLPHPIPEAWMTRRVPSTLDVLDADHETIWHFDAQTDGTLKGWRKGTAEAVTLQPAP